MEVIDIEAQDSRDLASSMSESESDIPLVGSKRKQSHGKQNIGKKKRPKAGDFDDIRQKIIAEANSYYRVLISTVDAFPAPVQELEFVKTAWQYALQETGIKDEPLRPNVSRIVCPAIYVAGSDY
jgi:hypothetical protein